MTYPYTLSIWHAPSGWKREGYWDETYQARSQEDALYLANLIHRESKAVLKVIRYGITLACFPNEATVRRIEDQVSTRWPLRHLFSTPRSGRSTQPG